MRDRRRLYGAKRLGVPSVVFLLAIIAAAVFLPGRMLAAGVNSAEPGNRELVAASAAVAQPAGNGASSKADEKPGSRSDAGGQTVYIVPVHQDIESGLLHFLERAFREAEQGGAQTIVLDIDTLGGRIDAATGIGKLIRESKVPTVAYVRGKAASAGSYIALNANTIYMQPGSSIGAAAVVDGSGAEVADAKTIAYWAGEMRAAAELRGRNTAVAEGMVDKRKTVTLPQIGRTFGAGEIVSLTAEEAVKVGYAEYLAADTDAALRLLGTDRGHAIEIRPTISERLARVLVQPMVMTLLLLVGISGVAIELLIPGFGLPGIIGLTGFALYFFGHYAAGFAGVEHIVLFAVGVLLLVIEIFLPTFGILGFAGIGCIVTGVVLAAYDTSNALLSLGLALAIAAVVVGIAVKYLGHRGIWNRFILRDALTREQGYSAAEPREHLLGSAGTALTPLRPAGTALIAEQRIDVVTSGEFIEAKCRIVVIRVEGARVVVQEQRD